jgi:hypothetical protein
MTAIPTASPDPTPDLAALHALAAATDTALTELAAILTEPGLSRWQRAARVTEAAGPVADALAVLIEVVARDPYPAVKTQQGDEVA